MIDINLVLDDVKVAIREAQRVLKTAPEGVLRTRSKGGSVRYFKREKGETAGRYLNKGCQDEIRRLEEKAYYTELLKVARQEEKDLLRVREILETTPDFNSVFLNIPYERRHLISPYERRPETDDIITAFNRKQVSKELKYITQGGEHVRSKSELIIADRLRAAGVPYYYEDPLILADQSEKVWMVNCLYWHPDFKVQNIRTGKVYHWEHFGMLDNAEYCKASQEKLEIYAQHGFFPGENLIITSESSMHSLNTEYVDCLIERYLK